MHALHQANHAARVAEGGGRLRLGIGRVTGAVHAQQAGDLVFLGLSLMHPRPTPRCPRKHPRPIDFSYRQGWCAGYLRFQLAAAVLLGVGVALVGQFGADLVGQTTDMTRTDLQSLQQVHSQGRLQGGLECGVGFDNLLEQGGGYSRGRPDPASAAGGKKSRRQSGQ